MGKTDTDDEADVFVEPTPLKSGGGISGLWSRYRLLPRNVFAISLVSLLNDASSEIIYPLLPIFLSLTLGASPGVVGLIEGAAESISSLLKLVAGYFSDRRGKRKSFVVFGYVLSSFVRPLLAFAVNWYEVLAIRLSDRVGKGIRSAPRDAMIADTVRVEERGLAFGFHRAMDHTGAVAGPLLGYLLVLLFAVDRNSPSAVEFKKIFLAASIPAMAAVAVAAFYVREVKHKRRDDDPVLPAPVKLSLKGFDSNFKRFIFLVALFTLSNSSDAFFVVACAHGGSLGRRVAAVMGHASRQQGCELSLWR